jgi:hypothetical protein
LVLGWVGLSELRPKLQLGAALARALYQFSQVAIGKFLLAIASGEHLTSEVPPCPECRRLVLVDADAEWSGIGVVLLSGANAPARAAVGVSSGSLKMSTIASPPPSRSPVQVPLGCSMPYIADSP